ncbi:hypothetical protein CLV67_12755 [Actinoplanes italicus]|uniref:Uncharacterized protein n=1 Tax=Actinoplanes italicus TaxID=113567 RepID=A0A2T0JXC1_9ACTN|nr:hypothetical protein CLV67_12755 [Actinoplanes italicus]
MPTGPPPAARRRPPLSAAAARRPPPPLSAAAARRPPPLSPGLSSSPGHLCGDPRLAYGHRSPRNLQRPHAWRPAAHIRAQITTQSATNARVATCGSHTDTDHHTTPNGRTRGDLRLTYGHRSPHNPQRPHAWRPAAHIRAQITTQPPTTTRVATRGSHTGAGHHAADWAAQVNQPTPTVSRIQSAMLSVRAGISTPVCGQLGPSLTTATSSGACRLDSRKKGPPESYGQGVVSGRGA